MVAASLGRAGITCSWCRAWLPQHPGVKCPICGGPLAPPAGEGLGEAPPPPPRTLPEQFVKQVMFSKNVFAIVGLVFLIVGALTAILLIGIIFLVIGYLLWSKGRRRAAAEVEVLKSGVGTEGRIVSVDFDTTQSINGRHPYRIGYAYSVNGAQIEGTATAWEPSHGERTPGTPVWVVYAPGTPSQSSLWPPVA